MQKPRDLNELEHFLKNIQVDDLLLLKKGLRSTKNLEGGPFISTKLASQAQIKKGYSVPANLSPEIVYGNPSFFKKEFAEVKDVIHNAPLKEALLDKIKQDLVYE